jgi:predicted GIY-YIG superfamily endonuclease
MPWVYILRCGDNTFYVGHTDDLASRLRRHRLGLAANYTALRLPVDLAYTEEFPSLEAAVHRERQLKRWSAKKKAALIAGDRTLLRQLSKRRKPSTRGTVQGKPRNVLTKRNVTAIAMEANEPLE